MNNNKVPIVFAFDRNLISPARVCLSSLLMNAKSNTFYDIYILYSQNEDMDIDSINEVLNYFKNCQISFIPVDSTFDHSFQIRGITTPAYYRLLIPELIPEYDKILYSDVDVIFREDLSNLYFNTCLEGYYVAGVDSIAHLIPDLKKYYEQDRKTDSRGNIYSGNLIFNSKMMREEHLVEEFKKHVDKKYKFQDMDIINIVCRGKIKYLPPSFCYTTYISNFAVNDPELLKTVWEEKEIIFAQEHGVVHYNGQKPWAGPCINFDIWWEYYRKSPFFDPQYYYQFFDGLLNQLDRLSLWERVKILLRYFRCYK